MTFPSGSFKSLGKVEQRFVVAGEVYARAYFRGRFLKRGGGYVTMEELIALVGTVPEGLTVPQWLLQWGADASLPSTKAAAPSEWS